MIAALLLGRKGSVGFPNKNLHEILGHPLTWYVMDGVKKSQYIDEIYLSMPNRLHYKLKFIYY
ncbi:hypothetical protein LCGC14_2406810 [marine sediment metagenome]|uniref:MobA-like NTP transferase domain-containing protein n=1 Tax=marine sediment metagenome TaxID=412755 RepID=A0A0F9BTK2_9ZZZZ